MLIVCPTCSTSYQVEAAALAPSGRSVRCARCKEIWFATPSDDDTAAQVTTVAEWADAAGSGDARTAAAQGQASGGEAAFDEAASWAEALNEQEGAADSSAAGADQPASVATTASPPLVPGSPDDPLLEQHVGQDVETLAALRHRRRASRFHWRMPSGLPVLIVLLIGVNAALINWRADLVRAFPQTASLFAAIGLPVNLRGLEFADIGVTREQHEGVPVLVVQGLIISVAKAPVDVPRLRLSIRNESGSEIYAWTTLPSRNVLAPGEQLPFRSRLASPPAEGREVQVRFYQRQDLAGGGR